MFKRRERVFPGHFYHHPPYPSQHYPTSLNQMYYRPPHDQIHEQTPFDYFSKPSIPEHWPGFMQENPHYYPQQPEQPLFHQQQTGMMGQIQNQASQIDLNKMLSTVGQIANTVQQVSPILKDVSSLINSFRTNNLT